MGSALELSELNRVYQAYIQNGKNKSAAARQLGIHPNTYRNRLHRAFQLFQQQEMPVICFWDIETSHKISAHYNLYNENINKENILLDFFIVCGAWKIRGDKEVKTTSILDDQKRFKKNSFDIRKLHVDDYHVVKTLHDMLNSVDILVHHNGDKFDLKMFNARALYHGLPPISKIQTVDTLKVARRHFGITSNALDYLCKFLKIQGKIHNRRGLSLDATLCKPDAIKEYVEYNKRDIWPSLEMCYNKLLPYIDNHPNMNLFLLGECCSKCGSFDIEEDGLNYSRTTVKLSYRCNDCTGLSVKTKSLKSVSLK